MTPAPTTLPTADTHVDDAAVCAHPIAAHDTISLRFCQATQASASTRGCVCHSS